MSSGGGSQTVTNKTDIDPTTQAWRSQILGAGTNLYEQGYPNFYPGQTVVPFADQTQQGLSMLQANAQNGAPNLSAANQAAYRGLSGFNPAMGAAQGFATGQNPFAQNIGQAANTNVAGQTAPMLGQASLYGGAMANAGQQPTTAGVGALQQQTQGGVNPALAGLWDQGSQQVANAVNSQFAQAGRYGANAAHTGAMTREMGNLWNQIYMPAYENQQNRSMQAGSQLAGIQQNDRSAQMAGYQGAAQLGQQGASLWGDLANADATRRMQGATTQADMGLQGANLWGNQFSQGNMDAARTMAMLPGLYDYGNMPAQTMMGVGGAWEGLAQEYLADDMARYNAPYQQAWNHLNQYAGLMSGLPDFSNQNTTSPLPPRNRALGALGGATAGAQVGSAIPGLGTGWGALIGGGLGLFT